MWVNIPFSIDPMGYEVIPGVFQAPRKPVTVHSVSPGLVADAGLAADREERLGAVASGVVGLVGCCRLKAACYCKLVK